MGGCKAAALLVAGRSVTVTNLTWSAIGRPRASRAAHFGVECAGEVDELRQGRENKKEPEFFTRCWGNIEGKRNILQQEKEILNLEAEKRERLLACITSLAAHTVLASSFSKKKEKTCSGLLPPFFSSH